MAPWPRLALTSALFFAACSVETHGLGEIDGGPSTGMDAMVDVPVTEDGCVPGAEMCNGVDDDCDGVVDEPDDLPPHPLNCGACGIVCEGATPLCQRDPDGALACVAACSGGLTECEGSCVDTQTEPAHCGGCGNACALANAIVGCVAGECVITSCMPQFDDCDGNDSNGCEASLTVNGNCGACGVTCDLVNATANCAGSGMCTITSCAPGFANCAGGDADGCETALGTDANCSACGDSCGAGTCVDGACESCPPGCTCSDSSCGTGPSGRCTCDPGCPCTFECSSDCDIVCAGSGTTCTADAVDANGNFNGQCRGGATCTFDVRGQSNVSGTCAGGGTSCLFDCRHGPTVTTSNCVGVVCEMGAVCRLRCGSVMGSKCRFNTCASGDEMACTSGGERWVTCGLRGTCP